MRINGNSKARKVKASQFNEYLGQLASEKWVIYNYRSGAMLDLNKRLYDAVKNSSPGVIENIDALDTLCRCNFFVDEGVVENQDFFNQKRSIADEERIIGMQILPTLKCNFRCTYCYEGIEYEAATMSDRVIEDITEHAKVRIKDTTQFFNVSWFGGEPLLAINQLDKLSVNLIGLCDSNGVNYDASIVTNGYLLSERNIEILLKNRIRACQVTIDGLKKYHDSTRVLSNGKGTWDVIVKNVRLAISMGIRMTIRINLDRRNASELDQFITQLKDLELLDKVKLSFSIVQALGQTCKSAAHDTLTVDEADEIIKTKKLTKDFLDRSKEGSLSRVMPDLLGCVATADKSLIIGPEGEIYKCSKTIGEKQMICGNIGALDYSNKQFQRWINHDNCKAEKCSQCRFLPVCPGIGCAYDSIVSGKDVLDCNIKKINDFHVDRLKSLYSKSQKSNG